MEMVLFIGIPGTGKSRFFREHFYESHVRINMDMLRTRHREELLLKACLEGKQRFVIDNTNVSREERARYISIAKADGFRVMGYYFSSRVAEALSRNATRTDASRLPNKAILGMAGRLKIPQRSEGFDDLRFVRICPDQGFVVEEWQDEV